MVRRIVIFSTILMTAWAFNGELVELGCPDDCDCHYFRVNWVTDCSDSNLTQIPYDEISQNVYVLDLNSNSIANIAPFPSDIKMRRFQIADNLLTELRAESFAGLHYLIDADFSGNKITRVQPNAFKDSAGLITLELQGNPLEPVEGPFLTISTLLYLDISDCGLTTLNDEFFGNTTALTTLDLSNNPLKSIDGKVFTPLTSLESVKMNNCNLTWIDKDAFISQSILKTLELAGNMLVKIEWSHMMQSLVRLEYLDLRGSHINKLPDDVFNNTVYMRTLILAENHLDNFNVASTLGNKLHQLDTLDLSYCDLNSPLSKDAFLNVTKLRNLLLSGNSLFSSDLLVALAPLVKLQKLSLSDCGLSVLPDTFDGFKSLQELDISMNPLNEAFIKLLAPLESLEFLNMAYCNLSHVAPTTFSKMTSLKRLILSGNDLNSLESGLYQNLTSLESLELNFCGLKRPLNATAFFNNFTYTDLTELKLAGNPLRVSPTGPLLPKQLSRLQTLDLSNCNLTFLPPDAFHWTRKITNLILEGNHFRTSHDLLSVNLLPHLKILDLQNNNLSSFSPKNLAHLLNLEKLKLVGNPWICDCSIAELWDWAVLEKGNIGLLEGSTIVEEHVIAGKTKRKKLLMCNYDANVKNLPIVLNKTASGRKPFTKPARILNAATRRTWGKYVRESGCEQAEVKRLPRSSVEMLTFEEKLMALAKHEPNTWATAAIQAGTIYCILMAIIITIYYTVVKNRQPAALIDKNN